MKDEKPELSVRIYKSTFANPQPDVEISSVDYVSTLKQAAPFLVGLTLEESARITNSKNWQRQSHHEKNVE